MTGLSNHALSTAPRSPLLMLFEARPTGIVGRSGLRVIIRSAGETLLVTAFSVILTVSGQYLGSNVGQFSVRAGKMLELATTRNKTRLITETSENLWKVLESGCRALMTKVVAIGETAS
jgi:hypothetical protein